MSGGRPLSMAVARAAHSYLMNEQTQARRRVGDDLRQLKKQAAMLKVRREKEGESEGLVVGDGERALLARVASAVDPHHALAVASTEWQRGHGFCPPDPTTLSGKKSPYVIKSKYDNSPMWDVEVSTILSENSALVLDLFLSAYHCELVRSRALVEAEAGAATGRQQESPSRDALHRDATHGLAGRYASMFLSVCEAVQGSVWAGPAFRDKAAQCLHFLICVALMDLFKQLSVTDGLTSPTLWRLDACLCPVRPDEVGTPKLLKRLDALVSLLTIGAIAPRRKGEKTPFHTLKFEPPFDEAPVNEAKERITLEVSDEGGSRQVRVPRATVEALKSLPADARLMAAMTSHRSEDEGEGDTHTHAGAQASRNALLHVGPPMTDEDLISGMLLPGRLELLRHDNKRTGTAELPRSLSPSRRRSQPTLLVKEPAHVFESMLPPRPSPTARSGRGRNRSTSLSRSPSPSPSRSPSPVHSHAATLPATRSAASLLSVSQSMGPPRSQSTQPAQTLTTTKEDHTRSGPTLALTQGAPQSDGVLSNGFLLGKLHREAVHMSKLKPIISEADSPHRAQRVKRALLYSPLVLDKLASTKLPGGLQKAGKHTLVMSYTASGALGMNADAAARAATVQYASEMSELDATTGAMSPTFSKLPMRSPSPTRSYAGTQGLTGSSTFLTALPQTLTHTHTHTQTQTHTRSHASPGGESQASRAYTHSRSAPALPVAPTPKPSVFTQAAVKSAALISEYVGKAAAFDAELRQSEAEGARALRTVSQQRHSALTGSPWRTKELAADVARHTIEFTAGIGTPGAVSASKADSELHSSLEVAMRVQKLKRREAAEAACEQERKAATLHSTRTQTQTLTGEEGMSEAEVAAQQHRTFLKRLAKRTAPPPSVVGPHLPSIVWRREEHGAVDFAKGLGMSKVEMLHLEALRKQKRMADAVEEEKRAVTEAAKAEVAAAQQEFRRGESELRLTLSAGGDSNDQIRWLPTPEEATTQKVQSCLRFLSMAREATGEVPMQLWGQLPQQFAQLTPLDLAHPVTAADLRAELLASNSDVV